MDKLRVTYATVGAHMDDILGLFKSGCKITVLVRTPGFPGRDFMMSDDDPKEVVAMIQRREAGHD
jgi:hypothetical protein